MNLFEWLRHFLETDDSKILFILALINMAMIIDFITGTIAAKVNSNIKFNSKAGINGIFIPLSVLVPGDMGVALVYTLYIGYLVMELKSIAENLGKMGVDAEALKSLIDLLSKNKGDK